MSEMSDLCYVRKRRINTAYCCLRQIPAPKDLSDEDLLKLLESEDQSGYRIPMSIGEGHVEVDNSSYSLTR